MMKYSILTALFFMLGLQYTFAQQLTIEMNKDTISLEETIQVKYVIDDACDASELKFPEFLVVSGPNVSRSISYVNGKRSAESSYTVVLTPIEEGTYQLPDSLCGVKLEKPVQIVVKSGYESKESLDARVRKKRKIKKI